MRRAWWWQGAMASAFFLLGCDSLNPVPSGPASSAASSGSPPPSSSAAPPPATVEGSLVLLTEVRFAPLDGDHAFVEISNLGSTAIDLAGAVLRIGAKFLVFDSLPGPLASGAILLVLFDALGTSEGNVLHAPAGFDLAPDSGTIELLDGAGASLDRVAWGDAQPAGVPTGPGGIVPDAFEAGTTIARSPGATAPGQPDDWVVTPRADASPGEPNAMPRVEVLLPIAGAILEPGKASLDWYPVPGAASYRVQAATDPAFGSTALDTTVSESTVDAGALAPGEYFWRVQAQGPDGSVSAFSEYSTFELAGATGLADTRALAAVGDFALVVDVPGAQLPVPLLSQHKDTPMLLLERNVENGAHAWDVDHGTLDPTDPSDNKNCAIAMTAMINQFYGGDLSQDRIGYEVRKDTAPGPEWDLNYGIGITGQQTSDALTFALRTPIIAYEYPSYEAMWADIIIEIEAGRPIAAANTHHGFVITGYAEVGGRRLMTVNDPWRGSYTSNIDRATIPASDLLFWTMPEQTPVGRMQEPGVTADSDDDGVVDFDETERFKTSPDDKDSDGDKLPDKKDIVTGVFDLKHGYARSPTPANDGRDFDFDGIPTELDPDSDRGGCQDGDEDKNLDGHRTGPETWNFDTHDDGASCGGWRGTITTTWETIGFDLKGTLSATVLFEPDPNISVGLSGPEHFMVTDGSATWSEYGSNGDCTTEGSGTYALVFPGDDVKDPLSRKGQLRIWGGGDPGAFRVSGLGYMPSTDGIGTTTITCDGRVGPGASDRARLWLAIGSTLPRAAVGDQGAGSATFPKDAKSFSGTFTDTIQNAVGSPTLSQTWTWTFVKVGK